jgi:hypothetical protein
MTLLKRLAGLVALIFGLVGVVACMGGIYGVCWVSARLQQANDTVFDAVDKGLATAQDRVRAAQRRVNDSKITSAEIKSKLRDWSIKEAKERIVTRLEIDSRTEKLAGGLETADSILEASTTSLRGVQQLLELSGSLGAPVDPVALDDVLEKLKSVQSRVQEIDKTVDQIRAFATAKEGESEDSRLIRITRLVGRMLLMMSEIDTRLEAAVRRLDEMRSDAEQMRARTSRYILLGTIACCAILVWIAAGQVALCMCGWKSCFGRRPPTADR